MSFKGFTYDFTGVEPAGALSDILVAGYYTGKVTGLRDHNDGAWMDISAQATRGRAGGNVSTFMATPGAKEDFTTRKWLALLLSAGFTKEQLSKSQKIGEKALVGKTIYFKYEPPPPSDDPDEKTYPNITIVLKDAFEAAIVAEGEAQPAAPAPATKQKAASNKPAPANGAGTAPKPAAAPPATPPATDDLDAELGLT